MTNNRSFHSVTFQRERGCGAVPAARGCAHSGQNFALGESWVPQFAQVRTSGVAHSSQNFACEGFWCWHRGHCIPSRSKESGRWILEKCAKGSPYTAGGQQWC